MATPIVEQITQAIVSRLQSITVSAGYEEAVSAVLRPHTRLVDEQNPIPDYSLIVYQAVAEPIDELTDPVQKYAAWMQLYVIACHVNTPAGSSVEIDPRLNQLRADVEQALTTDVRTWLGTLTMDKRSVPGERRLKIVSVSEGENPEFPSVNIVYQVPYMTVYGDPYTLPTTT